MNGIRRLLANKRIQLIIILFLSLLAMVSILQGVRNAIGVSQDFQWDAARALYEGLDPYEISLNGDAKIESEKLAEFYKLFTDKGLKQKMEANQFPSLLMLLFPYVFLSPMVARIAWVISNLFFTLGIIWLLRRTFLKDLAHFEFIVVALLMLAGTPYRNQIGVGQHTLFSFFFFMLAVYLDEKNSRGNSIGIAISLFISYFKYTLTAPLALYFIYKRRIKEFILSVAGHVILTFVAALFLKKTPIYMIVAPLKVASALSAEGGLDLGALFGGGIVPLIIGGVIALILFVTTLRLPVANEYILVPMLILWSLILTYHRTYDFFVLAVVSMFFVSASGEIVTNKYFEWFKIYYYILMFSVYFGLRVFDENLISRIFVGILYYIFTLIITIFAIKSMKAIHIIREGK